MTRAANGDGGWGTARRLFAGVVLLSLLGVLAVAMVRRPDTEHQSIHDPYWQFIMAKMVLRLGYVEQRSIPVLDGVGNEIEVPLYFGPVISLRLSLLKHD